MNNKMNKSSKKTSNYGKHISINSSGTYRVRMQIEGNYYDKSFPKLKDARSYRTELYNKRGY